MDGSLRGARRIARARAEVACAAQIFVVVVQAHRPRCGFSSRGVCGADALAIDPGARRLRSPTSHHTPTQPRSGAVSSEPFAQDTSITDAPRRPTMTPRHRAPTPPHEILRADFLRPLGLTQTALAAKMGIPVSRLRALVHGRRSVTATTALQLAGALGTTPEFWMNLQTAHDLWHARRVLRSAG